MPFPLAFPVALSAIQSLLKFRGRLDTILSLNETTTGLPFTLPPTPNDDRPHIKKMLGFFEGAVGKNILVIGGLEPEWEKVCINPDDPAFMASRDRLMRAYYEANDIVPELLGPDEAKNRDLACKGPTKEMRLAYYVVESHRLSRNTAVTRVLLAATDTLLEFGADNAGLFISNPRAQGLVKTLLDEFAVKRDWDDAGSELIFKTLVGATALAALENRSQLPDKPVLHALFDALSDVQTDLGNKGADFLARLVSRDGFQKLVGSFLVQAADQPGLFPGKPALKETLAAVLRETGGNLDGILGDPHAIVGVLEAGLSAAIASATPLLETKVANKPVLAVVLRAAAAEFKKAADARALFRDIADGELFTALYQASLRSLATNPALLADQAKIDQHVARIITGVAEELSRQGVAKAFSSDTLRRIGIRGLETLASRPEFLARHGEFSARILGAALSATSGALKDGFNSEDLVEITEAVVRAASSNMGLVEMDDQLRFVLAAIGTTVSDQGLTPLTTAQGRKELFLAALTVVSANPRVWNGLADQKLVAQLVTDILRALASDPSGLLKGPALVPSFRLVLLAAARRGRVLIDKKTTSTALAEILTAGLAFVTAQIGAGTDGENLPDYLRRITDAFLDAPFANKTQAALEEWLRQRLPLAA